MSDLPDSADAMAATVGASLGRERRLRRAIRSRHREFLMEAHSGLSVKIVEARAAAAERFPVLRVKAFPAS
jgi:hypothetical protein